jgi:hypothetical protein
MTKKFNIINISNIKYENKETDTYKFEWYDINNIDNIDNKFYNLLIDKINNSIDKYYLCIYFDMYEINVVNDNIIKIINNVFSYYINKKENEFVYYNNVIIMISNQINYLFEHIINKNNKKFIFYKIINIPYGAIKLNIQNKNNLIHDKMLNINYNYYIKADENNYIYRYIKINTYYENIENNWWFILFLNTYLDCTKGRLIQMTGSCWLNASINALMLSPKISEFMKKYFVDNDNNKLPFKEFSKEKDIYNLLSSLVYNLLIKKKKANKDDSDFMTIVANKIKGTYKCLFNKKCNNSECINYKISTCKENIIEEEGGDSTLAIPIIFTLYFGNQIKYYTFNIDFLNKIINNKKLLKEYYYFYHAINKGKINDNLIDNSYYNNLLKKYNNNNILIINNLGGINNLSEKIYNDYSFHQLTSALQSFTIGNNTYNLTSAVININDTHAICGIICNNESYIYDSNNILTKDNWINNNIKNYIRIINENSNTNEDPYKFHNISLLIYIKDEHQGGSNNNKNDLKHFINTLELIKNN